MARRHILDIVPIDASSESHSQPNPYEPYLAQVHGSYRPQVHGHQRDTRHRHQCRHHHHHCDQYSQFRGNAFDEDEDRVVSNVAEGTQQVADLPVAPLRRSPAVGFGDMSATLYGARSRASRSSHQVEEIVEEVAPELSQIFSTHCNIVGTDRVRRSRRFVDGSIFPPVMTSSADLRATQLSSSSSASLSQIEFNPPGAEWQRAVKGVFKIEIQRNHRRVAGTPRMFTANSRPRHCQPVAGDGNCLFRALSFWICGSEDYHIQVRQVIATELTVKASKYASITEEQGSLAIDYVSESRMAEEGVWGSDVEIVVSATLLRTKIAVYSAFGDHQYLWQVFEPLPPQLQGGHTASSAAAQATASSEPVHTVMLYIQNKHSHFEPVVDI